MGLSPFIETRPRVGRAGEDIKIIGTDLTGATSVTFNGTTAAFHVVSASEIITIVPTSAKTGEVKVVTPSGTLSSDLPFHVLP